METLLKVSAKKKKKWTFVVSNMHEMAEEAALRVTYKLSAARGAPHHETGALFLTINTAYTPDVYD